MKAIELQAAIRNMRMAQRRAHDAPSFPNIQVKDVTERKADGLFETAEADCPWICDKNKDICRAYRAMRKAQRSYNVTRVITSMTRAQEAERTFDALFKGWIDVQEPKKQPPQIEMNLTVDQDLADHG